MRNFLLSLSKGQTSIPSPEMQGDQLLMHLPEPLHSLAIPNFHHSTNYINRYCYNRIVLFYRIIILMLNYNFEIRLGKCYLANEESRRLYLRSENKVRSAGDDVDVMPGENEVPHHLQKHHISCCRSTT